MRDRFEPPTFGTILSMQTGLSGLTVFIWPAGQRKLSSTHAFVSQSHFLPTGQQAPIVQRSLPGVAVSPADRSW